jgi:hypothetical protein
MSPKTTNSHDTFFKQLIGTHPRCSVIITAKSSPLEETFVAGYMALSGTFNTVTPVIVMHQR